jgi:nucleoside-diphosphate-sugar epimerase
MNILITGASGFIGQELTAALLNEHQDAQLTLTDVVEPTVPASVSSHASRLKRIKSDLTAAASVESLFEHRYTAVYMLHGIMSSGSEANLELGLKVNLDSCRLMLDTIRQRHPGTKVIFASSCAVYGPPAPGAVLDEETCPLPQSSYGTQKHMVETLLNDYSRRDLIDGRACRLPTVIVRPGAPTAAASSFASSIVREPLKGEKAVQPIGNEDLEIWVCSPQIVVKNLIAIMSVPKEKFAGYTTNRLVNLPGQTVTIRQILDALEKVGGKEARGLVEKKPDEAVEKIVLSWAVAYKTTKAKELGLYDDVSLEEIVQTAAKMLKKG